MSETNIVFDRTRSIKDPLFVSVERLLKQRIEQLQQHDPDYELEIAVQRYEGLLAGDVYIEPITSEAGNQQVCISSRKTGFLRSDMNVFPLELGEIFAGLGEPFITVRTIHELLGVFLEKDPKVKYVNCAENSRLYAFVPGEDTEKEVRALLGDTFFNKVVVEQLNVEGNVPADYSDQVIKITDNSLINQSGKVHLISYKFAEDLVTGDRISVSIVPGSPISNFKEGNQYIQGNSFLIQVSYGDQRSKGELGLESLTWDQPGVHVSGTKIEQSESGSYLVSYMGWFDAAADFDVMTGKAVFSTIKPGDGKKILSNEVPIAGVIASQLPGRFEIRSLEWVSGSKNASFSLHDNCTGALVEDINWSVTVDGTPVPPEKVVVNEGKYNLVDQITEIKDYLIAMTRVRRATFSQFTVTPQPRDVSIQEVKKEIVGEQIHLEHMHKYVGLDLPVETLVWDGSLSASEGLKDPHQVTSFSYDAKSGKLVTLMDIVLPAPGAAAQYSWEWTADVGPLEQAGYQSSLSINPNELWMNVSAPSGSFDWDSKGFTVTADVRYTDGTIPESVVAILPATVTGPVDGSQVVQTYDKTTGEIKLVFGTTVPDAGATIGVKLKVTDGHGRFGDVGCEIVVSQKSTMTVTFLNAILNLETEELTWNYQIASKTGGQYASGRMLMPADVATNTKGGVLEATRQTFDKDTQTGSITYPIVVSTTVETTYTLSGTIAGDASGREKISWQFVQPATGGYSVTGLSATMADNVITQKLQVHNSAGKKAARANIITLDVATGVNPADPHPKDQVFSPSDQIHTFKMSVLSTPGLGRNYEFGGELFVDDIPIPFNVKHQAIQYTPTTVTTYMENGRACVELKFMSGSEEATGDFTASLISLTNKLSVPDFRFERKSGSNTRWIYSAAVTVPTASPLNYDFVVQIGYVSNMLAVSVQHSQRVTQNYETAGTVTQIPELCNLVDTGELISGVNPAGDLTQVYLVKLKDGTFPKSCKLKRPMDNVTSAVGYDYPQKETYDPTTGHLSITAKVYLNYAADKDFNFAGKVESMSPNSVQAATFSTNYRVPRHRNLIIAKTAESTNAARTEITVEYQASHEDGGLPSDVTMTKPFSRVTPSDQVTGYSPIREAYDKTTGKGSFVFAVKPKTDAEIAVSLATTFKAPGLNPAVDFRFDTKIAAMTGFKATLKSAQYDETTGSMRVEYLLKDMANAFPASCTMGDLTSATNTVGGTKTPTSKGYDPATGVFYYVIPVVKGTASGETLAYNFVGNLTVPGQVIPVTFDAPAYKYVITGGSPSMENKGTPQISARQIYVITRQGVSGNVTTVTAENLACAKKDPGRNFGVSIESNQLVIRTPVTTPDTTKRTYYTTTGNVVITTPEGMKLAIPFSSVAVHALATSSGQVDNRLVSMELVGSEMTVVVQSYWSASPGTPVYGGVLEVPFSAAYNTVPTDSRTPTSYKWNDADSTLTFKFNVQTPTTGNGGYYLFRARINYPEYESYTTDEFEVRKTFPLPEAIVAATYVDATLIGDVLTTTYLLKAPNGNKATSATMEKLDATLNAFDNSLAIMGSNYDPTTGLYKFSVRVKKVGLNTTLTYRMQGTVTTDTGKLALDRTHTSHSYTLTNTAVKWVTERLQLQQTVIRTSDETAVNDATFQVTSLTNAVAGKVPYSEHENGSGYWFTHLLVNLPAASGTTKYTGNGNFIVNQADGLKVYLPWTLDYDSQPYPSNTERTVELWDITWTANTVTFILKAQNPGRVNPPQVVMTPPIYRVYTPNQQPAAIPTAQSYDVNTGLLTITFTGTPPIATPVDYLVQGDVYFPAVSPTEKQAIYLKRLLTNKMNPNGTR